MKLYAIKKRNGQTEWESAPGPKKAIKKMFPESCPVRCGSTANWTYHVVCVYEWTGDPGKEYFYKEENGDTQIKKV